MSERTTPAPQWYLEGGRDENGGLIRRRLHPLPVHVGRSVNADVRLRSATVSGRHAEFFERDGKLWLRDLGSTNGTYLNFSPLRGEAGVEPDDIVHFAGIEFRIDRVESVAVEAEPDTMELARVRLATDLAVATGRYRQLVEQRGLRPFFQPIVHVEDRRPLGVELLSRGEFDGRLVEAAELFEIAAYVGRESELSELCRDRGAEALPSGGLIRRLFVNTHPREIESGDRLLESLEALSQVLVGSQIVVEIHESSLSDGAQVRALHRDLRSFGAELAFDDFGTGRSRLLEIAEEPPDYLKFDLRFIRGLDTASTGRRRLVRSLVATASSMGITPIAEGVETEEELAACIDAGFRFAQGFLLGAPSPIEKYISATFVC